MHTEKDPLDIERLDLKRTAKPRGPYADKVVNALSKAIISGEQSGPMQTIDRKTFKEEMRHELQLVLTKHSANSSKSE